MAKQHPESHWISLSDMMTSLMMVFLFISILYMYQVQSSLAVYKESKDMLYQELENEFGDKLTEWDMVIDPDLTIKFKNPDVLFPYRTAEITPRFSEILNEFIPQYLAIITKDEYKNTISEVRIEGHTADWDDYMYTIELSQQRSNSVLAFILSSSFYSNLPQDKKDLVKFWMTANGLGNGRAIDESGEYVFDSKNNISADSRRVEFKIVTKSDSVINEVINNNIN